MKVTEHLAKATGPFISFELIPPRRGGDIKELLSTLDDIVKFNPPFIDVTSHAAEVVYEECPDGEIKMRVKRKRPGTLGICALIQNKYNIDAVPHLLCAGFTREETEDFLIELHYLGIDNIMALRGDEHGFKKALQYGRSRNNFASELIEQISEINRGHYLEDSLLNSKEMSFCIGAAGYPEKHFEAPNLEEDIERTRQKVLSGADYIVTQMFFDNSKFYQYVKKLRAAGITVPIIPGLKIITGKPQLTSIPKHFYLDIPNELSSEISQAKPEQVRDIGIEWAKKQVEDLISHGVPAVHFYIMQNSGPIKELMKRLKI